MRDPRMFYSGCLYEIVFRARLGIPLPARPLINQIIESALARTQRDYKVKICNFIWMGNHVHILVISGDIQELVNFYGELKKRITESIKRLLNLGYSTHLSLWEDGTSVPRVLDLAEAVKRTIYAFCNPSAADLVDSIDDYPGLSTWREFCTLPPEVNSASTKSIAWIKMPNLPGLSKPNFSIQEEQRILCELDSQENKEHFPLTIHPFAWLAVFGVTESEEIAEYQKSIIASVREQEEGYRQRRKGKSKRAIGRARLLWEGISFKHQPKERGPRLTVLSSVNELRVNFLLYFKEFKAQVRECYELMKRGHRDIDWPIQAFIPRKPILANPLWG